MRTDQNAPQARPYSRRHGPREPRSRSAWAWIAALCILSAFAGCSGQEPIRQYLVDKQDRGEPTHRMLAATAIRGDKAWFFKALGPAPEIGLHAQAIRDWIASLRFDESGEPEWDLPEGWQQLPGSQMRLATLKWPGASAGSDVSVIPLPVAGDPERYVQDNINRWREQLQLPKLSPDRLAEQSETIALRDGSATLVDLRGWSSAQVAAASGGDPGGGDMAMGRKPPERPSVRLEYEVPEDWSPGQMVVSRGGITVRYEAAFEIGEGPDQAQVTVSRLPAMGGLEANINRWREQVGLESQSSEELESSLERIEVGDLPALYVRAVGAEQAILGAVAVGGREFWYFKLTGPRPLVEAQEANLRAFLESVQIKQ